MAQSYQLIFPGFVDIKGLTAAVFWRENFGHVTSDHSLDSSIFSAVGFVYIRD